MKKVLLLITCMTLGSIKLDAAQSYTQIPLSLDLACKILQIPRDITLADLKKQFNQFCIDVHPDKLVNASVEERTANTELFTGMYPIYQFVLAHLRDQKEAEKHTYIRTLVITPESGNKSL